jgi:plasmid maintenance system antidote protein VapI
MRKPEVIKQEFGTVLDNASKMCGGQNALARQIGVTSSNMAKYRGGKRSVPDEVVRKLAEVVGENPADVWLLAQDARNPFKQTDGPEGRI